MISDLDKMRIKSSNCFDNASFVSAIFQAAQSLAAVPVVFFCFWFYLAVLHLNKTTEGQAVKKKRKERKSLVGGPIPGPLMHVELVARNIHLLCPCFHSHQEALLLNLSLSSTFSVTCKNNPSN